MKWKFAGDNLDRKATAAELSAARKQDPNGDNDGAAGIVGNPENGDYGFFPAAAVISEEWPPEGYLLLEIPE